MRKTDTSNSVRVGTLYQNTTATAITDVPYTEHTVLALGDRGHYGYPDFPPNRDVGGAFSRYGYIINRCLVPAKVARFGYQPSGTFHSYYDGALVGPTPPTPLAVSEPDLSGYGNEAYNRMKPTKPSFQALNAIYELREVPEMLRQRFLKNGLNAIGDYYLALQFGWKPLLSDIVKTVKTQINMQKRLKQLLRDNGKPVRRAIQLNETNNLTSDTTASSYGGGLKPTFVTQYYPKIGVIRTTDRAINRVWASAEFRYWLPGGPRDINWTTAMMARIFGFQPSPAVIWNALPWTWMSDWFFNVGNILENMDSGVANRLAADWFYVMCHDERRREIESVGYFYDTAGKTITLSGTSSNTQFRKTRVKGDPFGFFTPENTLSGTQLAIMGALGISRLR